jgi:coenzyme F420-0:L-glutamate ligase/coenzyme F420-1:gamma-L-glutamate ligase
MRRAVRSPLRRSRRPEVRLEILPVPLERELARGDDLATLLCAAAPPLLDGDIVVVAHKAIAKVEGRVVALAGVEPSPLARRLAGETRDPRQVEVVLRESQAVVRVRGGLVIAETAHGFVCANAGVDRSNAPDADSVVLLPLDPDASAAALRARLEQAAGVPLGVVVADTFGRAFRVGIVGVAIGVSGLRPLLDHAGAVDPNGRVLRASSVAVADELAAAADLVLGKTARVPAAVVRGYGAGREDGSARELVRDRASDLFR